MLLDKVFQKIVVTNLYNNPYNMRYADSIRIDKFGVHIEVEVFKKWHEPPTSLLLYHYSKEYNYDKYVKDQRLEYGVFKSNQLLFKVLNTTYINIPKRIKQFDNQ